MSDKNSDNNRIAKNTAYLYLRTAFTLIISLYTSRVILQNLGVSDYGIYSAVGGVVGIFSILSGTLSSAISRYITFELGRKNFKRLKEIFTTSLLIQLGISILVIIIGETIGLWFVSEKMNVPIERISAAEWVWHSSLAIFIFSFLKAPYNATIIAHEHMNAYAIISVIEAVLKLLIVYLISISPYDKLVSYSLLLVLVSAAVFLSLLIYCKSKFEECIITKLSGKSIVKEIAEFAGLTFFNNGASVLNHQGISVLMNLFFGVTSNAARGVTTQVEHAVMQFVNNFTLAVNPQITKSYASGDRERMFSLVCKGSKYSYFLMLLFALPIFVEVEYILSIWLTVVPEDTSIFIRLSLCGAMIQMLGKTGYTACMATGKIRKYSFWITIVGCLTFPFTWVLFELGMPAYAAYAAFIVVNIAVNITRLFFMKEMLDFPISMFVKQVIFKILMVTVLAFILPFCIYKLMPVSIWRLLLEIFICTLSTLISVGALGMSSRERDYFIALIVKKFNKSYK